MNAIQNNKLRSFLAVTATLEKHQTVWQALAGFNTAVIKFEALVPEIMELVRIQSSRNGAANEKAVALEGLGNLADEIAGAVRCYATAAGNHDLAGRVAYARSEIVTGRENVVLARCRDIHAAASAHVDELADYGVSAAKLTKLKNRCDAFEAVLAKPRQSITASSAATKVLPARFAEADKLLARRLDTLMPQFKESDPEFFNEYFAARTIVDSAASRSNHPEITPVPAPSPSPVPA